MLYSAYVEGRIFGGSAPAERELPEGVERGDNLHLHFLTLTGAINYHRDEAQLWAAARETIADSDTHYVFVPHTVAQINLDKLKADLQKHELSKKPQKDADIWRRICTTLVEHFEGDMANLLGEADYNVDDALSTIRSSKYDFPYLGGNKLGSLWAHMLADSWQGHELTGLDEIPIYTDRDVVRGTVAIGAVRGPWKGSYDELEEGVVEVWNEACEGRDFYPMQFYNPLGMLGERGCLEVEEFPCDKRTDCPVFIFCGEAIPEKTDEGIVIEKRSRIATPISL
jgi:hypothetical protein